MSIWIHLEIAPTRKNWRSEDLRYKKPVGAYCVIRPYAKRQGRGNPAPTGNYILFLPINSFMSNLNIPTSW